MRRPDARIAHKIDAALGSARKVLNVGAGTGGYELADKKITAIEPSREMIKQRPPSDATVIQGNAENLPFGDNAFDAAMACLTIHHWSNQAKGVAQMRRVARDKVVFLTFDPEFRGFWLTDYFPALTTLDEGIMTKLPDYEKWLGSVSVSKVLIPHDCSDGFLAGYWRRPSAYLDKRVRSAMSSFWTIGDVTHGLAVLDADLKSGHWDERYGHLMGLDELDCGYRIVETN